MHRLSGRRPSPAMAVAFVALLAALSGTAVALPGKNTVDSGDIKRSAVKASDIASNAVTRPKIRNNAVNAQKVQADSLTGADINESSLGQVPSANQANSATSANTANTANSATTAQNANRVGGLTVTKISLSEPVPGAGTTRTTVFNLAGLRLDMTCSSGFVVDLIATAQEQGIVKVTGTNDNGGTPWGVDDFNFLPSDGDLDVYSGVATQAAALLRWRTATGKVLTSDFSWEVNAFDNPPFDCTLWGTAISD